jgi:hypothetical protein
MWEDVNGGKVKVFLPVGESVALSDEDGVCSKDKFEVPESDDFFCLDAFFLNYIFPIFPSLDKQQTLNYHVPVLLGMDEIFGADSFVAFESIAAICVSLEKYSLERYNV